MARPLGLEKLVALTRDAGVSLPTELLTVWDEYLSVEQLQRADIDPLNIVDNDAAADLILDAVARGDTHGIILQVGGAIEASNATVRERDAGIQALATAKERAAGRATQLAADLTETIISAHLAPALGEVLAEAAEIAPAVAGRNPDFRDVLYEDKETRAARAAWRKLEAPAARRVLIMQARNRALLVGQRTPVRDTDNAFVTLKSPQALAPDWSADSQGRLPYPDIPADPSLALLWYATTGQPAGPWCPTVQDQDAAWDAAYGERMRKRQAAATAGQWARVIGN